VNELGTNGEDKTTRIMWAMLGATGEKGYAAVTVADVLERAGCHRSQFYRRFENKGACYLAAYEVGAEALYSFLLESCEPGCSWDSGVREALGRLARFLYRCPMLARALLVEVYVAGGNALVKHNEAVERLSHAIDPARREQQARHSPPPLAPVFMIRAVESVALSSLLSRRPERFEAAVPDLAWMITKLYLGD
jgi:AcrR family transcriptional regulator